MHVEVGQHGLKFTGHFPALGPSWISNRDGFPDCPR
jgi:hypothetical protein